ncbi:MAG: hypothetical protein M1839_001496 [Geoglossum umbratile]|nr:MAG: hypothetical protein M1839_001496 [Geoglossum umbratile]
MKFSNTVLLSGLLAAAVQAVPQSSATSSAPTPTISQTPQEICLGKCKPGDVDCQAACIVVPAPNQSMVNDTHDCAAKCNQGSGSPSDTEKFSACVQGCITSHFFSATPTAGSPGASGSASASATGSASGTSKATGTASGSASKSGTASASAGATGAANSMQVGTSFAGIAGIMAAIFAL